jgi:hypothetical protein
MDELIARIVANVGLDADKATQAVGTILGFLKAEGPADDIAKLFGALPGAEAAADAANYKPGFMGGVMGLGTKLMGMGMGMGEIGGVAKQTMQFAREKAGDGPIDAVIASIPGLSQFA